MSYTDNIKTLSSLEEKLKVKQMILLEKAFRSEDPNEIVKAQSMYSKMVEQREHSDRKSFLIDPLEFSQSLGYRNKAINISYDVLRRMAHTPIINAIIKTRINQIAAFAEPQRDRYSLGFIITKKDKIGEVKLTKAEQKTANDIADIVMRCGVRNSWSNDDFDTFVRKCIKDSMTYDQMNFETITDKRGKLYEFTAVDASTIRLSESLDDDSYKESRRGENKEIKGYFPSYVQIYNGVVKNEFYPWEMCFGVRNPDTSIYNYGYGVSEIEELINVITAMLWSDDYNRRFFSQGSAPKGIIRVDSSISPQKLQEFKQQWQAMITGVYNAWKTPVMEAGKMDFINLQTNNRDMEYSKWNEYLIKVACSVFSINPEEVGFAGTSSNSSTVFESNNEAKLKHSQDKGLYPILKFLQSRINRYIIDKINPEYCLRFVGYDAMTRAEEIDIIIKKANNIITLDEAREELGYKPLKQKGVSDNIMSPTFAQFKMMADQQNMQEQQGDTYGIGANQEWEYSDDTGDEYNQDLTENDNPFKNE